MRECKPPPMENGGKTCEFLDGKGLTEESNWPGKMFQDNKNIIDYNMNYVEVNSSK